MQRRSQSHRWWRHGGLVVAASLVTLAGTAQPVVAEPGSGSGSGSGAGDHAEQRFGKVDLGAHGATGLTFTPRAQSNARINVMLQLRDDPVAVQQVQAKKDHKSLSKSEQRSLRSQLKGKQDRLDPAIRKAGGHVVAQLQSAYNGVQVQVREKDAAKLADLPGVLAVHKMRSFKPSNVHAVPYIGGPEAWGKHHQTGKGVTIGVIDTGIDYTHADFGGPGTKEAWDQAKAHSDQPANPALFGPAAAKVKGGTDFVGDDYDANTPGSLPKPDPNPLDCYGHGSHVAGSAAGFGVVDNGATYRGTYDEQTVSGRDWKVGPGVAPEADLYAYRVFGCEGSSDVVAEAIDQAVADHVDVINMSLGSDLGGVDDPTTVAAENAVRAGIAVVASSGNAGHSAYITGSPGTGNHVLSVAALDASRETYPGAKLSFSTGKSVDTINANGADLPTGSLPVKVLKDADGDISLGCDPKEYTDADVTGALVVTRRGTCARVARAVFAQKAGAKAVVMLNSDASVPPYEGPITSNPDTGESYEVTIPFLGAAGTPENAAALRAADGGTVTLADSDMPNTGYRRTADFSSAGPRNPDSAPKPEVTAPGVSIASVGMGTGNDYAVISGTSMAAPMTAGTAALVKQAHPTWTGDQIKAAIQNTTDKSLLDDYNVRLNGTGVVQADKAVDSDVLATTEDGLNSLAFGFVAGKGDYTATKKFSLTNTGDDTATYELSVDPTGSQHGAEIKVSPQTVQVGPGETKTVETTLSMSAQDLAALTSDSTFEVGPGAVQDLGGAVVATPQDAAAGQQTLRVAYEMVPRGLSDVRPGTPSAWRSAPGGANFQASLPLSNNGIHDGTADVYAWGAQDPQDTGSRSMDVRDVGVQSLPGGALGGGQGDRSLVFAVNSWGPATNHAVDEFDIAVDTNRDGSVDRYVVGMDLGYLTTGSFNGELASFTIDAKTNEVLNAFYAEAPMNASVVELPALASDLGVTSAKPAFRYSVTGFSVLDNALADPTSTASFDAFRPTVNTGQFASIGAGRSAAVPLSIDRGAQQSRKDTLGWLVVSVDDGSGAAQADRVAAPSNPAR